jgi:hypothetical protein
MKPAFTCALAALLLPLVSHAQTSDPADPKSAVPSVVYSSAFEEKAEVAAPAPDQVWRKANDRLRDGGTMDSSSMPMPNADENEHGTHHHHHGA